LGDRAIRYISAQGTEDAPETLGGGTVAGSIVVVIQSKRSEAKNLLIQEM